MNQPMFVLMFTGITLMAVFDGSFISSWLYLISFLVLCYGFAGSVIAGTAVVRYKIRGLRAKNRKWLNAEGILFFAYVCLPAYFSTNLHEYEGLTINHLLILGGATITTVSWLRGHRHSNES